MLLTKRSRSIYINFTAERSRNGYPYNTIFKNCWGWAKAAKPHPLNYLSASPPEDSNDAYFVAREKSEG